MKLETTVKAVAGPLGFKESQLQSILRHQLGKVPYQEREDVAQDMAAKLLDVKPNSLDFAFVLCKRLVVDWWRHFKVRNHYGVAYASQTVGDGEGGETQLIDLLGDGIEYAKRYDSKLDTQSLFATLPPLVKDAINKRLTGRRMSPAEQSALYRHVKANADTIRTAIA